MATQLGGASLDSGASTAWNPSTVTGLQCVQRRTKFIAQALQARQEVLHLHKMSQKATPSLDMMIQIRSSLRKKFATEECHSWHRFQEHRRSTHQLIRKAFDAYIFQTMTAGPEYRAFDRQAFWESIRTNNFSAEDTKNLKRYEDELRHRNAVITSKIMLLGICIAKAWKRSNPFPRSRPAAAMDILLP